MRIGAIWEETLLYADDVVVVANSRVGIQDVAKRWRKTMNANGMKINTQKGKKEVLVISRSSRHTCDVFIGQEKVHQVANYTYLGIIIGETKLQEVEVNNRIASNVGSMYPLLRDATYQEKVK